MNSVDRTNEPHNIFNSLREWSQGRAKTLALAIMVSFGAGQVIASEKADTPTEDEFEQFITDYQAEHGKNPSDELMMAFLSGEIKRLDQEHYDNAKEFGDKLIAQHKKELAGQE